MTRPTYLGSGHQPFATGDVSRPGYAPPQLTLRGVSPRRLDDRRRLPGAARPRPRRARPGAATTGDGRVPAAGVRRADQPGGGAGLRPGARESGKLRDRYGRHLWGQACLLARRLAEAGTAVISVIANTPETGPRFTNWDDHPGNAMRPGHFGDYMRVRLPYFDQAVSALIEDIFARGLDRKMLVVVMGEFGRTPEAARRPAGQLDRPRPLARRLQRRWSPAAGLRMGQVVGATNARGEFPTRPGHAPGPPGHDLPPPADRPRPDTSPTTLGRPVPILARRADPPTRLMRGEEEERRCSLGGSTCRPVSLHHHRMKDERRTSPRFARLRGPILDLQVGQVRVIRIVLGHYLVKDFSGGEERVLSEPSLELLIDFFSHQDIGLVRARITQRGGIQVLQFSRRSSVSSIMRSSPSILPGEHCGDHRAINSRGTPPIKNRFAASGSFWAMLSRTAISQGPRSSMPSNFPSASLKPAGLL